MEQILPQILLDPLGNVPMKLYNLDFEEIENNKDWKPRLFLSTEEQEIVESKGTVLVLGRSGTGKTLCVCNRIDYDGRLMSNKVNGVVSSQLFVARSQQLCNTVKTLVGELPERRFYTFQTLVSSLERELPETNNQSIRMSFLPSQKVGLRQFQCDLYGPDCTVDSLIVWSNIRTFIKGSIQCVKERRHMDRETYMGLGRKECRLESDQRTAVYDAFENY
jgi:hypothetical protein